MTQKSGTAAKGAKKVTAPVELADRKVARHVGKKRDGAIVRTLGKASELADQPPLIALSIATIAAGVLGGRKRLARTGLRMLASHWLATKIKSAIKGNIDRTRPFVMLRGKSYHAREGHSHAPRENSFPSGHTAGAVAVARAIVREYPASAPVGYGAAGAAGLIQLPGGAHYLSDVVVGGAIGFLAEALVGALFPADDARRNSPEADALFGAEIEESNMTADTHQLKKHL